MIWPFWSEGRTYGSQATLPALRAGRAPLEGGTREEGG